MKKKLVCMLVALLIAVTGCQSTSGGSQEAEPKKAPEKVSSELTVEDAFKTGKVDKVVQFEGQETVTIKGDEDMGERGHALDTVNQAKRYMKKAKTERLTVGLMYGGQRILQFTLTKDGKETLEKSHPEIEDYLKKAGHFKN